MKSFTDNESVPFAMLRARGKGKVLQVKWLALLEETKKTLKAKLN
jgi:hypothetical protein